MPNAFKKLKITALGFFILAALFSIGAQAQKRKPIVSKPVQMDRLADQGLKEMEKGQFDQAVKTFNRCLILKPVGENAFKCRLGRGSAYYALAKYEESIPDFTAAYDILSDKGILYHRGRAFYELKKHEEARKDFAVVKLFVEESEIREKYSELYKYYGGSLLHLAKYDEAIDAFEKDIELNPQSSDSYFGRAVAYELKGDFDNAEKDLRKMIELAPDSKAAADEVLERIKTKRNDESKKAQTINEDFPTDINDTSTLTAYADRYFDLGRYEKAVETYSKIIKLEPNNAKIYYKRGASYGNQSRYELAVADYTKAIELKPNLADAYRSRGVSFRELGKYEEAVRDLSKSIELAPEDDFGYVFRSTAYCKLGKKDLAKADEEKAKKLGGYIFEPCR